MPTPTQQDPTRSITLRSNYRREMRVRFGAVKKAIREIIVDQDVFGLKPQKPFTLSRAVFNVEPQGWRFLTNPEKVSEFRGWLQGQVDSNILQPTASGKPWQNTYVDSAYRKGLVRAYTDTRTMDAASVAEFDETFTTGKDAFLRQAFAAPETVSKLELLYTRNHEALRGVTDAMASDMSRILADGLGRGDNPRTVARTMTNRIDRLTRTRAEVIARTEIIHAHAEGQLDSFERLGIKEVDAMAEWSTAGDDRVCAQCAALEGSVRPIKEARGMIPLHPNCRCTWIPAPAEAKKRDKSKRGKTEPRKDMEPLQSSATDVDGFGNRLGTQQAKINAALRDGVSPSELLDELDIPKPTLYTALRNRVKQGYLTKNGKKYNLTERGKLATNGGRTVPPPSTPKPARTVTAVTDEIADIDGRLQGEERWLATLQRTGASAEQIRKSQARIRNLKTDRAFRRRELKRIEDTDEAAGVAKGASKKPAPSPPKAPGSEGDAKWAAFKEKLDAQMGLQPKPSKVAGPKIDGVDANQLFENFQARWKHIYDGGPDYWGPGTNSSSIYTRFLYDGKLEAGVPKHAYKLTLDDKLGLKDMIQSPLTSQARKQEIRQFLKEYQYLYEEKRLIKTLKSAKTGSSVPTSSVSDVSVRKTILEAFESDGPRKKFTYDAGATFRKAPESLVKVADEGADQLSKLWHPKFIEGANKRVRVNLRYRQNGRSFQRRIPAKRLDSEVVLFRNARETTALHELTHAIEEIHDKVSKRSKTFLKKRSKGASPKKLSDVTGNSAYKPHEITYEDDWRARGGSPYMGRVYNELSNGNEIMSMGVERLWKSPVEFFKNDPEYFEFVVRNLRDWF